ncbi:MAG TPA: hypothetical protein VK825_16140 [Xanthobacteraceae bacterium]|nr:hypothetical protein [Xanthobacteraceae bacterium]
MPILLGFILGVAMTITGAFAFDSATGRAANGLTPTSQVTGQAPMVNWAVVGSEWQSFRDNVRTTADNLERTIKQHAG